MRVEKNMFRKFGCKWIERNMSVILGESHKDLFQVKGSRQMNISRQTEEVTEVKMMKYFGERKGKLSVYTCVWEIPKELVVDSI